MWRSIADLERRAVLGPRPSAVVKLCGGDVGVAEPGLDEGDVGGVLEGVGGGGGPQGVQAQPIELDAGLGAVAFEHLVDAVAGNGVLERAGGGLDGPEECPGRSSPCLARRR